MIRMVKGEVREKGAGKVSWKLLPRNGRSNTWETVFQ